MTIATEQPAAGIEHVVHQGILYGIIVRSGFSAPGITFFTPDDFSQQMAYMEHPSGHQIAPHVHNFLPREVSRTREVLILRKGRLRVDFFSQEQEYLSSRTLEGGDVILLANGGHGFEVLEPLEMLEIKQGPYTGETDKTRFDAPPSFTPRMP